MFEYGPKIEKSIYVQGMCIIANIYFLIRKRQQRITKECILWTSWAMIAKLCLLSKRIMENILAGYLIYRSIQ